MRHEVIVGNIGNVLAERSSEAEANTTFHEYVKQSEAGHGRAAGEPVTWLVDGEIHREHTPPAEPVPSSTYFKVWVEIEQVNEDLDEYTKVDLGFAATANFKHEADALKFAHALHACGEDGLKRLMPAEVFYEH